MVISTRYQMQLTWSLDEDFLPMREDLNITSTNSL